jgi:hypothetical protein
VDAEHVGRFVDGDNVMAESNEENAQPSGSAAEVQNP